MTFEAPGAGALDYSPCRYGGSRLVFRGPRRALAPGYAVAIGSSMTYGRFIERPWPARLERQSGRMVVNLGLPHAGPDAFLLDPEVMRLARGAALRIVQLPGAVNLVNPLYSVHPRRNDRFLEASPRLRGLYPEVDFIDFAFTRHMIRALAACGPQRFAEVAGVLRATWLDRMRRLLAALDGPTVLVWFADRPPPGAGAPPALTDGAPLLLTSVLLDALRPQVTALVEVVVPGHAGSLQGKGYGPLEEPAARALPGPEAHRAMARAMLPWVVMDGLIAHPVVQMPRGKEA